MFISCHRAPQSLYDADVVGAYVCVRVEDIFCLSLDHVFVVFITSTLSRQFWLQPVSFIWNS